jgi:hypothetical protein
VQFGDPAITQAESVQHWVGGWLQLAAATFWTSLREKARERATSVNPNSLFFRSILFSCVWPCQIDYAVDLRTAQPSDEDRSEYAPLRDGKHWRLQETVSHD